RPFRAVDAVLVVLLYWSAASSQPVSSLSPPATPPSATACVATGDASCIDKTNRAPARYATKLKMNAGSVPPTCVAQAGTQEMKSRWSSSQGGWPAMAYTKNPASQTAIAIGLSPPAYQ